MRELTEKLLKEYLSTQRGNEVTFTVSKMLWWAKRRRMRIPAEVRKYTLAVVIREELPEVTDNLGRTWVLKSTRWQRRWNNGHRRFTYVRKVDRNAEAD